MKLLQFMQTGDMMLHTSETIADAVEWVAAFHTRRTHDSSCQKIRTTHTTKQGLLLRDSLDG